MDTESVLANPGDLSAYQRRVRALWCIRRYLPVAWTAALLAMPAGTQPVATGALLLTGPPLLWLVCERARDRAAQRAGVRRPQGSARNRARDATRRYLDEVYIGVCLALAGIWVLAGTVIAAVPMLMFRRPRPRSRPRIRAARPIADGELPDAARLIVDSHPGACVFRVPDQATIHPAFATGNQIYISDSIFSGPADELEAVVAHELAHVALGATGARRLRGALYVCSIALGWLVALSLGRSLWNPWPLTVTTGVVGATVAVVFGTMLAWAALEPVWLWYSRRVEKDADRRAALMLGTGDGFARFIERRSAATGAPTRQPGWFHLLSARHPQTADRIASARAFGRGEPIPGGDGRPGLR